MPARYSPFYILLLLFFVFGLVQVANNLPVQAEGSGFDCANVTQIPQSECEALVAFYDSTNGDNWENNSGWLETNTPCSWFRVNCSGGHVIRLRLYENQLSGALPPELSNLPNLTELVLHNNQLGGEIPSELGTLSDLTVLHLHNNHLSGTIPVELSDLSNLSWLYLSGNQLSGSIPPQLGNLTNLIQLGLQANQLSGTIPPELGNLTNLTWLYMANNELSGSIPPELGNLVNLTALYLYRNQLSGTIPSELGNLAELRVLYLCCNQLTGEIPAQLANLTHLHWLMLHQNQLSGPIPAELGNLSELETLSVYRNQLTGNIPPELGNLTNLAIFRLHWNQLSGAIPPELGNLNNLTTLSLFSNPLSGPLPLSFVNLTKLFHFAFHHTNLCEPPDPVFQQWIANIPEVHGPGIICDHTPPPHCQQANPHIQPLLLVTGWSGSRPSAAQDDQLRFFFGDDGHLAPYGYVEGCNLFYANGTSPRHWLADNANVIRNNLCIAYPQVKAFNPDWNGRFDIIAHSYGGLRARAYLENPDLYGRHCAGGQNEVYVDNLFTLGTPHGGEPYPSGFNYDLLPFAFIIGLEAAGGLQLPALAEMHPHTRDIQNLSSSQPADTCYYLLSGDARPQSSQFPWRLVALTTQFPKTYLVANDLAVHRTSGDILSRFPYTFRYPNTVSVYTPDLHGHAPEERIGQHNLRSFVNPNTTFAEEIWPSVGRRICSPSTLAAATSPAEPTTPQLLVQQSQPQTTAGIPMMDIAAGSLDTNEMISGNFTLNGTGASQIMLSWVEGNLILSLVDPDGTPINPTTIETNPNVDYVSLNTGFGLMATYLITNTVNGVWQYTITSEALEQAVGYRLAALPPTPIAVSPSVPQWLLNNTPVAITATVNYSETEPVTGGEVTARIQRPDGVIETISLYDDGEYDDGQVNSGVFGGVYTQTAAGGVYGMLVIATGIYNSETFTRTATAYFVIAPGGAALIGTYNDSGIDETGDGIYEWLELEAGIAVTEATTYTLSAELYAGETFIAHARHKMYLDVGQQTIPVRFAGPAIFEAGLNGPYTIRNVILLEEAPLTLLIETDDNVHVTQAYRYTDFGHHRLYLPIALRQ
jgi:Leucine-rich repeat (LRR) protein